MPCLDCLMASVANVVRWVDLCMERDRCICMCVFVCVCLRGGDREREGTMGGRGSVCKISTSGIALIQLTAELERDVEFCLSRVEFTRSPPF